MGAQLFGEEDGVSEASGTWHWHVYVGQGFGT